MPPVAASTNSVPICASCTFGHRFSVHVSSSAPRQRRDRRRDLHRPAARIGVAETRDNHAERGDLRDRQVDEHDAALQTCAPSGTCVASTRQAG
jgi:hypothetical protein